MRNIFIFSIVMLLLPMSLLGQDSQSRYDKEFVFVQGMRNISLGASPVILNEFMYYKHPGAQAAVTLPPVHLMYEMCFWDLSNAGSFGLDFFVSYGRYKYTYEGDDGYGGNEVDMHVGTNNALVGLSYHYTIRTRLEAYTRLMAGMGMASYKSNKAGDTRSMYAQLIWNAVVGMRYYFSNSFGVYVEGGYTPGGVDAGLTFRW